MGKILFTERSSGTGSWAVYDNSVRICGGEFEAAVPRAPSWFTDILAGLENASIRLEDIEAAVVGTGPGSFSGIRANLAALQGLCMPSGKPVLGLSSSAALAFSMAKKTASRTTASVAVAGDARRGQIWYAVYAVKGGKITLADGSPVAHNATDFSLVAAAGFTQCIKPGTLVVSSEYEKLASLISAVEGIENPGRSVFPGADILAELYYSDPAAAIRDALPVYLQPAVR